MNTAAVVQGSLDRIAHLNESHRALVTVDAEGAISAANASERRAAEGSPGPLEGLTLAVKDNIDTAGVRTTAGSAFFAERVPQQDAVVVQRLKAAGAIMVAKANTHEFAFGATTQNPHHGFCRNAVDANRIPGGSSGGSGAAVGLDLVEVALGSDTGGSTRIPAALNGVAGIRPTHGLVPNTGSTPAAASFDTIGPMAREVSTVARTLHVMAGYDIEDAYCADRPGAALLEGLHDGVSGLRVGVPTNWFFSDCEPEVVDRVQTAIAVLESSGAVVVPISLPGAENATAVQSVMMISDARSFHDQRVREAPEKFGPDVLERLRLAERYSALDYARAKREQASWIISLRRQFAEIDLIATPTVPRVAPLISEAQHMIATTASLSRFTYPWSLAGVPALSVPAGLGDHGMPVGLQLIGPWWADARVLAAGAAFQSMTDHHYSPLNAPTGATHG